MTLSVSPVALKCAKKQLSSFNALAYPRRAWLLRAKLPSLNFFQTKPAMARKIILRMENPVNNGSA